MHAKANRLPLVKRPNQQPLAKPPSSDMKTPPLAGFFTMRRTTPVWLKNSLLRIIADLSNGGFNVVLRTSRNACTNGVLSPCRKIDTVTIQIWVGDVFNITRCFQKGKAKTGATACAPV